MDKKAISEALKEAINKKDLNTRAAAKALNLNPIYISMAQNPKSWDAMGKTPWIRLEEWLNTRGPLALFNIPEGEEIWKPKEKAQEAPKKDVIKHKKAEENKIMDAVVKKVLEQKETEWHSPENLNPKSEAPFLAKQTIPEPGDHFTDTARFKVALDIEINLVINGQKVNMR
jgi:hypothetical protein